MSFLRWLEQIRVSGLNEFMLGITYLGDEIAFLVIALIVFWCVDKRKGYFVLSVGFFGTLANQFMKLWFRIPRPWIQDPELTVLGNAKEAAGGYSFPSGHSQTSVGIFGGLALTTKNKVIRIVCVTIAVLVPFSRMYLGVHTPLDVLVGSAMALVLLFVMKPLIMGNDGKRIPIVLGVMAVSAVAYLCFVEFYTFPKDVDATNLASATKNAYTILGALLGFLIVYPLEEKFIHFPVKAVWWAQILKVALGLALVLAVKEGLSAPLKMLLGEYPGRMVRYFLIAIVGGALWPLTFNWFSKLGKKA